MRNVTKMVALSMLLTGCSDGNNESGGPDALENPAMFSGSVAGNEYMVEVHCAYFDKDYFQFKSDKTDVSDTNGDGVVISGMETNGKFSLTIIDNGNTFSTGKLSDFSKGDNTAEGAGQLFEEGTANAHDVRFSVVCG